MKKFFLISASLLLMAQVFSQNSSPLLIKPSDIRLEPEESNNFSDLQGFHLYIRKLPKVESIMLVETTKDPEGKSDSYAYRAMEYNKVNGDEIRFLNGKKLESEYSKYSLVDSTPEKDDQFGEAFHIYIPHQMEYGYPWARSGKVTINRGTFINIRSFEKKYGDYTGAYYDNAYMFDLGPKVVVKQEKPAPEPQNVPVLTDDYNPVATEKFGEFSDFLTFSKGPETIIDDIMESIENINPKKKVDIVFAIDATGSMKDDIEKLRAEWIPKLVNSLKKFNEIRLGLLLYRDYPDNFRYKSLPVRFFDFTDDIKTFERHLNNFTIKGNEGGDIPEAVYEALYGSLEFYAWAPDAQKKIILIGDAEPHPTPRGTKKYTKELVMKLAVEKDIHIDAIITPDEKYKRGR